VSKIKFCHLKIYYWPPYGKYPSDAHGKGI